MIVEVAAAVIERADGAFLLAQRPAGKVYAGWWEFPGGKIEPGEPAEAALGRELHEELGIDARRAYPWITRVYAYEHATVRLHFFRVVEWQGEPHPREDQAIRWQRLDAPMAQPMLPANAPVLASLALPLEYAITCAAMLGEERMLACVAQRLDAGLRLVQVREPQTVGQEFAQRVIQLAHAHGAKVLTKTRVPGTDGVHYTAKQLMAMRARPGEILAAASCHDEHELAQAERLGFDFAVLGAVQPTASHPGARPLGWEKFARLARGARIPVYAIGGLVRSDLDQARRAGAHGIAMIRGSWA